MSQTGDVITEIEKELARGRLIAYRFEIVQGSKGHKPRIVAIAADDIKTLLDRTSDFGIFEIDPDVPIEEEYRRWSECVEPMKSGRTVWSSTPWSVLVASTKEQQAAIAKGELVPAVGVAACEADMIILFEERPILPDRYQFPEE